MERLVMPRLFVGNFQFEHELAARASWQPSAAIRRMSAERVVSWISLADDGDAIWTPEPIPDDFWESLAEQGLPRVHAVFSLDPMVTAEFEVIPWGWSEWTRAFCSHTTRPSGESVIQANSREWSFKLEQDLGIALSGTARVERMEDFKAIVSRSASEFGEPAAEHSWVLKANFGMASRERLLGRGPTLTSAQQSWLAPRLAMDRVAFFEPWLRRQAEVGIQWTLPELGDGKPRLEGITPLLCDAQGNYRGSEFSLDTSIPGQWQRAVEACEQAAKRLQVIGYWGPLGIDAAIYEDTTGSKHIRPLQDINARYTMGRLALGFRRCLHGSERGVWQHGRAVELCSPTDNPALRQIDLTPQLVGGRPPSHGSRLRILN